MVVTGGLGFIGSSVARRLVREGAKVSVVDNLNPQYGGNRFNIADIESDLTVRIGDIRDPGVMESLLEGCDYLFNLAAQTSHMGSMQEPHVDLQINAVAQLSIVEAARKLSPKIKIIYASTRQLYGRPKYLPVDEAHPIRPTDVNGVSKLAGEQFHLLYNDVYGIRATVLRLTNTYGPGMRIKDARQTFIGIWVRRLLEKQSIRSSAMACSCATSLTSTVPSMRCYARASSRDVDGKVFNLGSRDAHQSQGSRAPDGEPRLRRLGGARAVPAGAQGHRHRRLFFGSGGFRAGERLVRRGRARRGAAPDARVLPEVNFNQYV